MTPQPAGEGQSGVERAEERLGAVNPTFSPHHDPWTTMLTRFGAIAGWLGRRLFSHIHLSPSDIERIRECAREGTIVYVMRYPSMLDTLLMNLLFLEADLPLAHMSNGKTTLYMRRPTTMIRIVLRRLFALRHLFGKDVREREWRERAVKLMATRKPILLFLRGTKLGLYVRRVDAVEAKEAEKDLLGEILQHQWSTDEKIFLVPLAVFWRKGPRQQSRAAISSIFYGVKERPGDVKKFLSFLLNYRDLFVRVGKPVDLRAFMEERRAEGSQAITKKLRRSLQLFLYREEKVVHGPVIRPRRQIRDLVVEEPEVRQLIEQISNQTGEEQAKIRRRAERYFREIAANFHGTYIAFLDIVFNWIYARVFTGIEVRGLEKVADCARRNPLVLIPCHRSHFDYLIISSLFYHSHLSPPHIAAGINLSFWPMGPLFRGAGAYFLRRSFGENELYKTVFRKYITFLIKEGYTQEFFIEGGRSRMGKMLNPKLGMLSMIIDAYVQGVRRDLYFVPVSITYDRLVEEKTYVRELQGGRKERESLWSIMGARKVLERKYGKVHVSFGEPISLREALGDKLDSLRTAYGTPEGEAGRKDFIEGFGYRILRSINATTTATSTAMVATALLARPKRAVRSGELFDTLNDLNTLLRLQHVTVGDRPDFEDVKFQDTLRFFVTADLVSELTDDREVVYTFEERRRSLDFYKNNIIHYFVVPSILAQRLRQPVTREELMRHLFGWIELFRYEFFLPEEHAVRTRAEVFLSHFISEKLVEERAGELRPTPEGLGKLTLYADVLANFREAYFVVVDALVHMANWPLPEKKLLQRADVTFKKYHLLNEIRRAEASSRVTYDNALRYLVEERYLESRQESGSRGRKVTVYDRGPRFGELPDLRRLLASSLYSSEST
jgi:glycerol-3-phosphate O-acyltransferase